MQIVKLVFDKLKILSSIGHPGLYKLGYTFQT